MEGSLDVHDIIKEFNNLLDYHIRKLMQLTRLKGSEVDKLEDMLRVIGESRRNFDRSNQAVIDVKKCIAAIKTGQRDFKDLSTVLPIQIEILYEIDLFLMRHDLQ